MGQFVVHGLELPSVYVRTKFEDVALSATKKWRILLLSTN